jgi:hypothetical protein
MVGSMPEPSRGYAAYDGRFFVLAKFLRFRERFARPAPRKGCELVA